MPEIICFLAKVNDFLVDVILPFFLGKFGAFFIRKQYKICSLFSLATIVMPTSFTQATTIAGILVLPMIYIYNLFSFKHDLSP